MPPLHVPFTKMQGAGNDFIVVDNRFLHFTETELGELARRFCPRRFGVGADGLLALDPPDRDGADYRMRYHNADGSLAGMCGNGARCLARFARASGIEGDPLVFDALAGRYSAAVPAEAGAPVRLFVPPARDLGRRTLQDGRSVDYVYTGTHHAVVFVDDLGTVDVAAMAPAIRRDPAFPEGANVNFVQVVGDGAVLVRTFEKGVEAETLACGTGALAAAAVARERRHCPSDMISVGAQGGTLIVGFSGSESHTEGLFLEGPAETVFTGILELDPAGLGG